MSDNKKHGFLQKLSSSYRLAILNDRSLEEKAVIKTTPLWIFLIFLLTVVCIMVFSFLIIAYSPLNEHVPGKTTVEVKKELLKMSLEVDSLLVLSQQRDLYLNNLRTILNGGVPIQENSDNLLIDSDLEASLKISKADSLFRLRVEEKSRGDYIDNSEYSSVYFFPPIVGELVHEYSAAENHFGVDVVAKKDAFISSVDDGRVVLSDWTRETGFVIGVQHRGGFLSLYKHNSKLLKNVGDFVKVGDPIAVIGDSGEMTSGPHLHFELWKNGKSVNPINYISF